MERIQKIQFGYSNNPTSISDATVVCTVEVEYTTSLLPIIRTYRGTKYVDKRDGPYGDKYNDVLPDGMYGFWVKLNGGTFSPSNHINSNDIVFKGVDIRRVVAQILSEKIKVKTISIENEVYTDIDTVELENERIIFDAISGAEKVKICIPININSKESNVLRKSTKGFYVLESTAQHLLIYGSPYTVYGNKKHEWDESYPCFSIDLFYGEANAARGIFYYYDGDLVSKYAIEKDNDYKYLLSDIRGSFFFNDRIEYKIKNGANKPKFFGGLKPDKKITINEELFKEFLEEKYLDEKSFNNFKIEFEKEIIEKIKYPSKGSYCKDNVEYPCQKDGKTYCFELDKEKQVDYYVELNERKNIVGSDYSLFLCDRLGDLKIQEDNISIRITLSAEDNDWIIEYLNGEKSIKVTYKLLKQCNLSNIELPSIQSLNEYEINNIKLLAQNEYKKFISILREVDRLCKNERTYEFLLENS